MTTTVEWVGIDKRDELHHLLERRPATKRLLDVASVEFAG